jgi:hypothetical protein
MSEGNENQKRRVELKLAYGAAYAQLSDILFHEDPIGINFEENTDEYEPEVDTIFAEASSCAFCRGRERDYPPGVRKVVRSIHSGPAREVSRCCGAGVEGSHTVVTSQLKTLAYDSSRDQLANCP